MKKQELIESGFTKVEASEFGLDFIYYEYKIDDTDFTLISATEEEANLNGGDYYVHISDYEYLKLNSTHKVKQFINYIESLL